MSGAGYAGHNGRHERQLLAAPRELRLDQIAVAQVSDASIRQRARVHTARDRTRVSRAEVDRDDLRVADVLFPVRRQHRPAVGEQAWMADVGGVDAVDIHADSDAARAGTRRMPRSVPVAKTIESSLCHHPP